LFNVGINVSKIINERAIREDPVGGFHIGTGAYRLVEFSPSDFKLFERNENYWGPLPPTRVQRWTLVTEPSARTIMLRTNEAQIGGVPEVDLQLFRDDPNFGVYAGPANNFMGLLFNLEDPIAGDMNFRMAVTHALDIEVLSIFAMGTLAFPVLDGTIWGYAVPYKNESIPRLEHNLELAAQYLSESVYNGELIEIATTAATGGMNDMVVALVDQLRAVGIYAELNIMDVPTFAMYTNPVNNQSQLNVFFGRMSQNPVDTLMVNFAPGASNNRTNFNNAELNEWFERIGQITDEDEKIAAHHRMQEIVVSERPMVPIFWMPVSTVHRASVGGFVAAPSAMYDWRYVYWRLDLED
jgi:ABC-type transport system substrate-binding protein